jgi:uncharacterized membrane protein
MKQSVILYLCTAVVMWPLDLLWLGLVARTIYRREIGGLLLDRPEIVPAALFYLVYVVGIVVFAVRPAVQSGELATALAYGALFGFMAYATYDLTNLATLRGYTLAIASIDLAWGTFLTAISAGGGFLLARAWGSIPG